MHGQNPGRCFYMMEELEHALAVALSGVWAKVTSGKLHVLISVLICLKKAKLS